MRRLPRDGRGPSLVPNARSIHQLPVVSLTIAARCPMPTSCQLLIDRDGSTTTKYAILTLLVALAVAPVVASLGHIVSSTFSNVALGATPTARGTVPNDAERAPLTDTSPALA